MLATVAPVRPVSVPVWRSSVSAANFTWCTVSTVAGSAGPVVGTSWNARVSLSALTPNGTTLRTPSTPLRAVAMRACSCSTSASERGAAWSGRVDTATIGAVGSRPELGRDGRVGRVRGRAGRLAPAVGQAELDLGDRDRHDPEQCDDADDGEPRVAGHEADVPGAVLLLAVVVADGAGRDVTGRAEPGLAPSAPAHDPGAHEPQHRRADGDRDEHRDGDRGGGDHSHLGEDRDAGQDERPEGDDHRGAGEHHGAAGGGHGPRDRLAQVHPVQDVAAVPVDDEQRVVDADREPEHQRERRCRRVELDDRRERDRSAQAHPDTEQRDEQRQAGGDEAAEHDDEHEHRDAQAEDLAGADEHGLLGDLEAVVRRHAGGLEGGGAPLRDQGPVGRRHGLGVLVEAHLRDGIAPVLADQPGAGGRRVHGGAVLVLRATRRELGLALGQVGLAGLDLLRALLDLGAQPGDRGVVGVRPRRAGRARPSRHRAGPRRLSSWARPSSSLAWPVVELRLGGGELLGGGVELVLRLEGVDDALDVRHLLPAGEDLLDRRALGVGELLAVALEHDAAEPTGGLGDLGTEPVEHLLERRAGDRDPAAQRLADGHRERPDAGEHDEPDRQDAPRVGGAPAGEAVQER